MSIPESLAAVATFIAQTTGPSTQPKRPGWVEMLTSSPIVPLVLVMLVFLVFSSRTRRRQERAKQDMLGAMKRGDRVQTIGGILGNVVEVRDDRILLKVDEGNNTKVWFARNAILRVLGDEADAK